MDDKNLWEMVKRNINPLKNRDKIFCEQKQELFIDSPTLTKITNIPLKQTNIIKKESVKIPTEMDLRTAKNFKRLDGRLDLHGRTRQEAHHSLSNFILNSYAVNKRNLLVITGKGKSADHRYGVLKREVPLWLESKPLSDVILSYKTAKRQDGGEGALYIKLRKKN